MKPNLPEFSKDAPLNSPEHMLATISVLAYHLAIELDMNYEDEDSPRLTEEVAALEMAAATLFISGLLPSKVVHHSIERFMD